MPNKTSFLDILPASLADAIDEIVYVVSASRDDQWHNGRVEYVSGQVRTLLGHEPEDFKADLGLWLSLVHPDDLASLSERTRETFAHGRPVTRSYRVRHASTGEYRLFDDRVVPRFDDKGALIGFVGAARDVTDSRKLESHLGAVLDRITDGFFTLDRELRFTHINRTGAAMAFRAPDEIVGRGLFDVFPDVRGSAWERVYQRVMDSGVRATIDDYYEPLERWFELDVFPSTDGVSVFFRDITDRKLAQRSLQEWFDKLPVFLIRNTIDGRILEANAMAVALLGYPSREALIATPIQALYANPDDRAQVLASARDGSTIRGESVVLRHYDGSLLPVLFDGNLVRNANGEVVEVLGSARLPSATEDLRQSLLQSHQRYQRLFDDNVTPMLIATRDGLIVASNQALIRLVRGGTGAAAAPLDAVTFFGGAEAWRTYVDRLAAAGTVEGLEHTLLRADGSSLRVLISGRIVPGADARKARIESSFVDIEARSQAEDSLRRAHDEREVLLREIHHRVKNNLQIVSSLLDLQARRGRGSVRDFVEVSRERIRAMAMVHERLYQSKDFASVRLQEYLNMLLASLRESHGAQDRGIVLESECPDIIVGLDDGVRCGLIVNELVLNSLKHAFSDQDGGTLRIGVSCLSPVRDHAIVIRVTDDGRGFPIDFDAASADTLGMQLIAGLAQQGGGSVRWSNTPGATVEVELVITEPRHPQ